MFFFCIVWPTKCVKTRQNVSFVTFCASLPCRCAPRDGSMTCGTNFRFCPGTSRTERKHEKTWENMGNHGNTWGNMGKHGKTWLALSNLLRNFWIVGQFLKPRRAVKVSLELLTECCTNSVHYFSLCLTLFSPRFVSLVLSPVLSLCHTWYSRLSPLAFACCAKSYLGHAGKKQIGKTQIG